MRLHINVGALINLHFKEKRMKIFDIETDGFLEVLTVIHCAWIYDTDTEKYTCYNGQNNGQLSIEDFLIELSTGETLAHFGNGFDYLAIEKLYPDWKTEGRRYDSVLLSQLIWTNLSDLDFIRLTKPSFKDFPRRLIGSHSLKAWGHRLGEFKGEFNPKDTGHTWETIGWTQEMEDYCGQDATVTLELWRLIQSKNYSVEAMHLEQDFAAIIKRQERFGFKFDEVKATKLQGTLAIRKAELAEKLQAFFPPWEIITDPHFIPKVNNNARGYVKGVATQKNKMVSFNPNSRDHIAGRLIALFGWVPEVFNTNDGKPKVDETILRTLAYEPVPLMVEYLTVNKRVAMLADGKQAWLKAVKDGRIHGRVNTMGAVTGRCTHSNPNVAQVPSVTSPYGSECRELFTVDRGYKLVGADASGLELRCLAHYMAAYDDGAYGDIILNGDIHTANQEAAGLPTRDNAKTFIYGFLYGAGNEKLGEIVGKGEAEGKRLRAKFLKSLPALKQLTDAVKAKATATKTLKGLDGRILHCRSPHSALNTLLQSAGAVIMKQALIELDSRMRKSALKNSYQATSPDSEFVANIHDEYQIQVLDKYVPLVQELAVTAMTRAGKHFNFKCRIDGEAKFGNNWKETH